MRTFPALLPMLSASRFLVPDFPLLVPAPFPSPAYVCGPTFPFLSDRNFSQWIPNLTWRYLFFWNNKFANRIIIILVPRSHEMSLNLKFCDLRYLHVSSLQVAILILKSRFYSKKCGCDVFLNGWFNGCMFTLIGAVTCLWRWPFWENQL